MLVGERERLEGLLMVKEKLLNFFRKEERSAQVIQLSYGKTCPVLHC